MCVCFCLEIILKTHVNHNQNINNLNIESSWKFITFAKWLHRDAAGAAIVHPDRVIVIFFLIIYKWDSKRGSESMITSSFGVMVDYIISICEKISQLPKNQILLLQQQKKKKKNNSFRHPIRLSVIMIAGNLFGLVALV